MTDQANPGRGAPPQLPALWLGLLAAPLAWAVQFSVNYALVYFLCGVPPMTMHLISLAAVLAAGVGLVVAWQSWDQARAVAGDGPTIGRIRFMAGAGTLLSSLFLLLTILTGVTPFFLAQCNG